jgi:hypothetical protein
MGRTGRAGEWVAPGDERMTDRPYGAERGEFYGTGRDFDRGQRDRWGRGERGFIRGQSEPLEGRITDVTNVDVFGRSHTVATVETPDNRRIKVSFGPREQFERDFPGQLRTGETVNLRAHRGQFHDRSMYVVDRLEREGQWVSMNTDWEQRGMGWRPGAGMAGQQYRGEILSTRHARFSGFDRSHLLARVRMNDGSVMMVDLGPARDVENFGLRSGDSISFAARDACINGSEGLIAEELRTPGGRFVQLDNAPADSEYRLRGRPTGADWREGGFRERSQQYRSGDRDLDRTTDPYYDRSETGRMDNQYRSNQYRSDDMYERDRDVDVDVEYED